MAKFKLYLMSLRGSESEFSPCYSLMPISEFNTQYNSYDGMQELRNQSLDWDSYIANRGSVANNSWSYAKTTTAIFTQDQSFTYTSNEKFQIHQNSQRSLTFTMYRNVIRADRIEINPFINYLFIGAQLLLVDKYDNHHLMTVSKISYQFNELNTEFSYECQDSFSYQLSRQNTGYEIENSADGDVSDFIGAQTLDWWVLCKIHPECKISYQYLKLDDENTTIKKQSYTDMQYKDYHRTVPFSGSGTANSVLIALGELYGLQLNVYERMNFNTGVCLKYYWFAPMKSLRPTGLKYSPYGDLQSFTLEHSGNSFASVLNIQNNTIGEEIITAIPSVPNFFRQWFETEEWRNSSFYVGLFSSACQEHVDYVLFDGVLIQTTGTNKVSNYTNNSIFYNAGYIYIPIKPNTWHSKYEFIQFSTNGGAHSKLTIAKGDKSVAYNSKYNSWQLIYKLDMDGAEEQTVWSNTSEIPYELINKYGLEYFYLKLDIGSIDNIETLTIFGDLYISQYRIPTTEELEFAAIADQLPWLENKLISFDYFYEHSIINASEHSALMRLLENDLRKANAKLLLYSQLYYQAMQSRTEIMAKLSSKLDLIGATFQADILNPYLEDGRTTKTTDFVLAMSDLFVNSTEPIALLSYYELLTDYVNKYFNAEQAFLKNMYLFRNYFESKANLGTLYTYNFELPDQSNNNIQISFTTPNQYISLTEDNSHYPIYEKQDDAYVIYNRDNIVQDSNITRFHYLNPSADGMTEIINTDPKYHGFSDKQQYFELVWKVKVDGSWPQKNDKDVPVLIVWDVDGDDDDVQKFELELLPTSNSEKYAIMSCYMHGLHSVNLDADDEFEASDDDNNNITVTIIEKQYKPVDYTALRNNFFYQTLRGKSGSTLNFMHRRKSGGNEMMCQISSNTSHSWVASFSDLGISPQVLLSLPNSKNWDESRIQALENLDYDVADDVYKEHFPITSMYWQPDGTTDEYHDVPFVNVENCQQFHRRVSLSCEEKQKWDNWSWINYLAVPLIVYGIAYWAWSDGQKDFGNNGWTYHDIFNCNYSPAFGDGWTSSTRFMYVTNSDGYNKTHKKEIFPSQCFGDGEAWHGLIVNDQSETVQGSEYQDIINEDLDVAQVANWGYHEAKNIPLTYYSFMRRLRDADKQKYHYKTKYWRILKSTDVVSRLEGIEVIVNNINFDDSGKWSLKVDTSTKLQVSGDIGQRNVDRLNMSVYYPLKHAIVAQNLSEFKWPENVNELSLQALLENNDFGGTWGTAEEGTDAIWTGTIGNTDGKLIFVKTEDFQYEDITALTWNKVGYEKLWEYASSAYYDNETHQQINLIEKYPQITIGFYVRGNEAEDYIPATQSVNNELSYYEKINNKYEPRYTLTQLVQKHNMYIQTQNVYTHASFGQIDKLNVPYFIYNRETNMTSEECGTLLLENGVWKLSGANITNTIQFEQGSTIGHGKYIVSTTDFNNCTNGWFWHEYKNATNTILMEKAMLIETNLTEYWTNAYYASKNCRFFLPEYWQPTVDQKTNYFSKSILSGIYTKNNTNNKYQITDIKLSSIYIPQVAKLPNQPRYQFRHSKIFDSTQSIRAAQYGLNIGDSVGASSIQEQPIKNIFDYLKLNPSEWMATKLSYGDSVLYQHQGGGMLWTDTLVKLTDSALQYDQFGGWYDMMIGVLQSCNYQNYDPVQYYQAQEEHDAIWKQIYIKYPNLIYEQAYTNEDATTSQELLTMAQWAFKDHTQPESNYNISVIDSNTLKGYKGQELAIGDGIEVNATELYDDAGSDIYKSLVQYLYVTDISYDLRQDDNIQLTVNSIKYRDKVIGELVKLIR